MGMRLPKHLEAEILARADVVGPSMAGVPAGPADGEWHKPPVGGVPKQPKGPNKLEQAYAAHLEILKRIGDIVDYKFESVKLKIGVKTCWFCPDFWVLAKDGVTEYHETKGWMRDDAAIKLKSAALQYPHFRFFLVRKDGKQFSVEAIK